MLACYPYHRQRTETVTVHCPPCSPRPAKGRTTGNPAALPPQRWQEQPALSAQERIKTHPPPRGNYALLVSGAIPFVVGLLADAILPAPYLYSHPTVTTLRDPPSPQGQFVLLVYCLQFSTHENTPVSRIVYTSRIYYPLLYGSIVSHRQAYRKPLFGFTLTIHDPNCCPYNSLGLQSKLKSLLPALWLRLSKKLGLSRIRSRK